MKKWMACLLVLGLLVSCSGCKKGTAKIDRLERSNQDLAEAARRTKAEADRVKQQNQEYLDALAKAGGGT